MPKKVRRLIFYCLIAVFLVLGSGVVLYAQGWRMAFQPFGVGKVGGIYIRTFPANAQAELNGKIKERKIGLFEKGTLVSDILPGEYDLNISSPGFYPWNLAVAVSSTLVTSMPNIVLIPNTPTTTTSTPVQDISLAGTTLILRTASGTRTLSGIATGGNDILAGSEDGTVILSYATSTRNYFSTDIPRSTSTNLGKFAGQPAGKAVFSFQPIPGDDTLFLAKSPAGLNLLRVPTGDILRLSTSSVASSAAAPGKIIWAIFDADTNASLLSAYDIRSQDRSSDFEFVPGQVVSMMLLDSGDIFALAKGGALYSLNFNQSSRVRLATNIRNMTLSSNSEKMAILDGEGAQILFLRGNKPDLNIKLPDAARIQRLIWYRDTEHLFVQYPDRVMFLDLIDTELRNFRVVANTSKMEYEPSANILYFLKDNTLQEVDFPTS
jgi:hypothetical protein